MKKISIVISISILLFFVNNNLFAQCCDYTYQQQVEPITSAATFGVALGDFDDDGDQDAVTISAYYGVDVYFNDGSGTFTLNAQYATGTNGDFYGVHVCDVDADGDEDIIAIPFYSSARLTILKNNGTGLFTASTVSSNIATYNAAIGDVDGDNDIDVFLPSSSGTSGKVFKNNGTGVYTLFQTVTGARGHDAELGDLDGDGDLDAFVVSNSSYGNTIFLNDSTGNFTQFGLAFSSNGSNVDLGDLDGDGDLDAWIGRSNDSSEIWLNDGSATFTLHSTIGTGSYCKAVNLYDFDGDGDLDVFLGFYSSNPQVWNHKDNMMFSLCYQAPVGSSSHGQAVGFINNDNSIDFYSGYFSNNDGDYVFLNVGPSIEYANSPFCPYVTNPQNVTLSGTTGGVFFSSPAGLDIDSLSGAVIPVTSIAGTYLVDYIISGCTASTTVVIKSLDMSTIVSGTTITANQDSATYQWVDCNNSFMPISGETGQSYIASTSGDYAVIITYDGCTDTSACVNIVTSNLYEITEEYSIVVYPNPANSYINVKTDISIIGTSYTIYDQVGKAVLSGKLNKEISMIELGNLSPGIYTLRIGKNTKQAFKVIKE
ncbi:MAG: T9SS type A sorting domain-containing protein [Bacteroidales bacterium]|nr:T9SS type A sorting domain-containing protein [Bacteroidales bacterium]